jgi:hypothetical protein
MAPTRTTTYPAKPAGKATSLVDVIANPEFVSVAVFCAIGLLLTLNVMLRVPGLAELLG